MSAPIISSLILPNNKLQNYEEEFLDYRYSYQVEFKSQFNMNHFHWHRFYEILFIKSNSNGTKEYDVRIYKIHRYDDDLYSQIEKKFLDSDLIITKLNRVVVQKF